MKNHNNTFFCIENEEDRRRGLQYLMIILSRLSLNRNPFIQPTTHAHNQLADQKSKNLRTVHIEQWLKWGENSFVFYMFEM